MTNKIVHKFLLSIVLTVGDFPLSRYCQLLFTILTVNV
jgi:hypothetical protein